MFNILAFFILCFVYLKEKCKNYWKQHTLIVPYKKAKIEKKISN